MMTKNEEELIQILTGLGECSIKQVRDACEKFAKERLGDRFVKKEFQLAFGKGWNQTKDQPPSEKAIDGGHAVLVWMTPIFDEIEAARINAENLAQEESDDDADIFSEEESDEDAGQSMMNLPVEESDTLAEAKVEIKTEPVNEQVALSNEIVKALNVAAPVTQAAEVSTPSVPTVKSSPKPEKVKVEDKAPHFDFGPQWAEFVSLWEQVPKIEDSLLRSEALFTRGLILIDILDKEGGIEFVDSKISQWIDKGYDDTRFLIHFVETLSGPICSDLRNRYNLKFLPAFDFQQLREKEKQALLKRLEKVKEQISERKEQQAPEVDPETAQADSGNGSGAVAQEPKEITLSVRERFSLLKTLVSDQTLSVKDRMKKIQTLVKGSN